MVDPSTYQVETIRFCECIDLTRPLGSDTNCNICTMRNLMWLMCQLRIVISARRKTKAALAGLADDKKEGEAESKLM